MSYCLNPDCQKPQNSHGTKFCQKCGTKLLLAQRYRAIKPLAQGGFGKDGGVEHDIPRSVRVNN